MVAKKHKSNRVKAKDKYKIKAKVREHARKVRKLAKQNPKKTKKVVNHIPNDFPFKEELLVEAQNYKAEKSLLMQQKKAAVDAEPIESEKVLPVLKLYPKVYEMWKDVVNDSDFIIQVIDAREPVFSRAMELETLVQKQKKKLLIILTKCDLVPASNLKEWVAYYSKFCPTVPFSKNHCTSESVLLIKEYLLQLKAVKIGIVGFPGVGKSTVIAFLRKEVDCPTHCGIIFSKTKNEAESSAVLFRNYSNAAKIPDPVHALKHLVNKVGLETICNYYKVAFSANIDDFIIQIARKQGFIRRVLLYLI